MKKTHVIHRGVIVPGEDAATQSSFGFTTKTGLAAMADMCGHMDHEASCPVQPCLHFTCNALEAFERRAFEELLYGVTATCGVTAVRNASNRAAFNQGLTLVIDFVQIGEKVHLDTCGSPWQYLT